MASIQNKPFWLDFIALYQNFPELWKVKSDVYKNRNLKSAAHEVLVDKLKEIDSSANRDTVKKKINALRSNYRRELLKINRSQKSGAGADDICVPSLWYFKEIDFLRDQEISVEGVTTLDYTNDVVEEIVEDERASPTSPLRIPDEELINIPTAPKRKKISDKRNELLELACKQLRSGNDEAEILAKSWALSVQKNSTATTDFR